ncbi:MAG: CDP-diacylglycerol--serine O-phosphatidyltransferase [Methanosarcinales archaeon]|nr:CDP-diacylglycerol--serine O-phosphatidyltransferase [Methanosarcinales archaeon]
MNIFRSLAPPDFLSLLNIVFGFSAILCAASGRIYLSLLLVLIAATWDGMDGILARRRPEPGNLGANLDSLADLVSFGATPAVIAWIAYPSQIMWLAGMLYVVLGTLRLARFNISPRDWTLFEGLPITFSGVSVCLSILLNSPELTMVAMLFLAGLMVSSLPYPKIRDYRILGAIIVVALGSIILGWSVGDFRYSGMAILVCLVPYLLSPVLILWRQKRKRQPLRPE